MIRRKFQIWEEKKRIVLIVQGGKTQLSLAKISADNLLEFSQNMTKQSE